MFSCVSSTSGKKYNAVSLCKERKRLLKQAVERREAFVVAQCKYNNSFFNLSKAMSLFAAKHSSYSSSYHFIHPSVSSDPPHNNDNKNSHHTEQEQKKTRSNNAAAASSTTSEVEKEKQKEQAATREEDRKKKGVVVEQANEEDDDKEDDDDDDDECPYTRDGVQRATMATIQGEGGCRWDFFCPYNYMVNDFGMSTFEDVNWVRQQEGILQLEGNLSGILLSARTCKTLHTSVQYHARNGKGNESSDESSNGNQDLKKTKTPKSQRAVGGIKTKERNDSKEENDSSESENGAGEKKKKRNDNSKGCKRENKYVIESETGSNDMGLLKALEEIQGLFVKAYQTGMEVSKMLEATKSQLKLGLIESSSKTVWSIVRNRHASTRCSACKSVLALTTAGCSSTAAPSNDLFAECGGMTTGSLSMSMEMLFAWERKFCEDVEMGENAIKHFEQALATLLEKEARGEGLEFADKTRLEAKALHATIKIALSSAETISNKIVRVRDEQMQPQLFELLGGLMRMWTVISKSHETLRRIMFEVASLDTSAFEGLCSKFHQHAISQLGSELERWRKCFVEYISAQKAYLEALDSWFAAWNLPEDDEVDNSWSRSSSATQCGRRFINEPPVVALVRRWLDSLRNLPDESVASALKSYVKQIKKLCVQHGKEHKHKRKVTGLLREHDKRAAAIDKAEAKIQELKSKKRVVDGDVQDRIEHLDERKNSLQVFKQKLEMDKAKHLSVVEESQRVIFHGFQTGFSAILESLVGFSQAIVKMYDDLRTHGGIPEHQ